MADDKDLYILLGVTRGATPTQLSRAYHEQALIHHPDRGGDPAKFREAKDAFDLLNDRQKRDRYNLENPNAGKPEVLREVQRANEAEQKATEAEQKATEAEQRATTAEAQVTELQQQVTELQQQLTELQQQLTNCQQRADTAEHNCNKANVRKRHAERKAHQAEQRATKAEAQVKELQQQLPQQRAPTAGASKRPVAGKQVDCFEEDDDGVMCLVDSSDNDDGPAAQCSQQGQNGGAVKREPLSPSQNGGAVKRERLSPSQNGGAVRRQPSTRAQAEPYPPTGRNRQRQRRIDSSSDDEDGDGRLRLAHAFAQLEQLMRDNLADKLEPLVFAEWMTILEKLKKTSEQWVEKVIRKGSKTWTLLVPERPIMTMTKLQDLVNNARRIETLEVNFDGKMRNAQLAVLVNYLTLDAHHH